jgi:cytochrome c5
VTRRIALVSLLTFVSALAGGAEASAACRVPGGDWRAGTKIYLQTCMTCHGESGEGVVAGVPDLRAGILASSTSTLMQHVKNGFRSRTAPKAMAPKGGNPALSDQDVKNVLDYLYHQFGCG